MNYEYQTVAKAPFTVTVACTGEGHKNGYSAKAEVMQADVEVLRHPDDGRRILSFGWPWTYYLADLLPCIRGDDRGICVDGGAGYVISRADVERTIAWLDSLPTEALTDG